MWRNRLIKISTLVREEPEKEKKPLKLNSPAGQKKKFKSRDLKFLTEPQSFEIFLNVRRKTKILTEFFFVSGTFCDFVFFDFDEFNFDHDKGHWKFLFWLDR